ncbi:4-(cytidine 5'-diphospho)-2-C-methyl-D-erythritol kinase [Desulfococcaceae bacterium HSG8]|nr:4-(cytidine 5'-diphospho)-2-C-methyl-D-erythritol kinase [Desulfococcaceae bacterium HSG8]
MKLSSPAKINLFLHVTGKRPDGYHELYTLMCCIDLCDTLSFTFGTGKIAVSCDDPNVPEDETNIAHKAAALFLKELDMREGVEISINKRIPVGAGLGGGSSNAATVLSGLNQYYGHPFSQDQLINMGCSIGADVPFFIFQKPAIATGIGEKLEAYENLPFFKVVLIYPGFAVSTATVYKNFNLRLTKCKKNFIDIFFRNRLFEAKHHLCNDLEVVTVAKYPEIPVAKALLLKHGAEGAIMSGSGSSVFGLFSDTDTAENAKEKISENKNWKVYLADIMI